MSPDEPPEGDAPSGETLYASAKSKYEAAGLGGLARSAVPFAIERLRQRAFEARSKLRLRLAGSSVLEYRGVRIDLAHDALSDGLRSAIMRGYFEREEYRLVRRHARSIDGDVIELGGGIGFVSTVLDRILDDDDRLVVVEANDEVVPLLRRTRSLNDGDFDILNRAYAVGESVVTLHKARSYVSGSTRPERRSARRSDVETVTLAALMERFDISTFTLVADIEGSEFELIDEELPLLADACSIMIVEFHDFTSEDVDAYVGELLGAGFELADREGSVYVFENPAVG